MPEDSRKTVNNSVILGIMVIVVLAACSLIAAPFWWPLLEDPQKLRDWLTGLGIWAPAIFVFLQALQIVIFVLPGEITQIAAGWVFGFGWGSALAVAGTIVGSAAAFGLARKFGAPLVHGMAGAATVAKFDKLMASPRFIGSLFLLFLIPGVPKDILCYVAGLSTLRFLPFLVFSTVARLPGILGSSLMGKALYQGDWLVLAAVAGGALVLFGVGWFFREPIFRFIERFAAPRKDTE
jgi:uncharacterized membrane protein YdjX (TVP38/TMEM64 family)